jgi:hypothetical protein
MTRTNVHQPPSEAVIAELMRAGVSHETAMAMERWKAQEVLELLRFAPDGAGPALPGRRGRSGAW